MIDISNKTDYLATSIRKNIRLIIDRVVLDNKSISQESMTISDILMSEEQLTFGGCNSSKLSISVFTKEDVLLDENGEPILAENGEAITTMNLDDGYLIDKDLVASIIVNDIEIPLGKYIITSAKTNDSHTYITIEAIGILNKANIDVTEWYNTLHFPMSIKTFRNLLFNHLGILQETVSLPFDELLITKGYNNSQVNGIVLIRAICEVNARFGKIDRNGIFTYQKLATSNPIDITSAYRNKGTFEKSYVQKIDGVVVNSADGTLIQYGSLNNPYVISNPLLYGLDVNTIKTFNANFLDLIKDISYMPVTLTIPGLPYMEVGDFVRVNESNFYIFDRKLSGIQALVDEITCNGSDKLKNNLNSFQNQILQLAQNNEKLNIKIEKSTDGILLEVSKKVGDDEIISKINQSPEDITIEAKKLNLNGYVSIQKANEDYMSKEDFLSADKTTIDGGKISTNSVKAQQIDVDDLFSETITAEDFRVLDSIAILLENSGLVSRESRISYNPYQLIENMEAIFNPQINKWEFLTESTPAHALVLEENGQKGILILQKMQGDSKGSHTSYVRGDIENLYSDIIRANQISISNRDLLAEIDAIKTHIGMM